MAFDKELAAIIAFNDDFARDFADDERPGDTRFFAGRRRELNDLAGALEETRAKRGVAFRTILGAPGSGKTSLLERFAELHETRETMFVELRASHLSDMDKVARATSYDARRWPEDRDVPLVGMKDLDEFLSERGIERVVLWVDDVHDADESCAEGLRELRGNGIGRPTLTVLVGRLHAADRLRAFGGLSESPDEIATTLGGLSEEECVESTTMLFDRVHARGSRLRSVRAVARMSLGWPRLLKEAQKALCRELLLTKGDNDGIDGDLLSRRVDEARFAYYEDRIVGTALDVRPRLTASVVGEILRRGRTADESKIEDICGTAFAGYVVYHERFDGVTRAEFARSLIETGVLSRAAGGGFEIPIPSMEEWLATQALPRGTLHLGGR